MGASILFRGIRTPRGLQALRKRLIIVFSVAGTQAGTEMRKHLGRQVSKPQCGCIPLSPPIIEVPKHGCLYFVLIQKRNPKIVGFLPSLITTNY